MGTLELLAAYRSTFAAVLPDVGLVAEPVKVNGIEKVLDGRGRSS